MLIGFAGKRTAGKTEAATILIQDFGFEKAKFAEAIKVAVRHAYGLTLEHIEGDWKETPCEQLGGRTPRFAMEWFGEESRKLYGADIWVRRWFDTHGNLLRHCDYVFDDVRNPVEAEAIKAHGGKVVMIVNERASALKMLPSEQHLHLIKHDLVVVNDETPAYHEAVRQLANNWLQSKAA